MTLLDWAEDRGIIVDGSKMFRTRGEMIVWGKNVPAKSNALVVYVAGDDRVTLATRAKTVGLDLVMFDDGRLQFVYREPVRWKQVLTGAGLGVLLGYFIWGGNKGSKGGGKGDKKK